MRGIAGVRAAVRTPWWLMSVTVLTKALGATVLSSVNWDQDGLQNLWGPPNKSVRPLVKKHDYQFQEGGSRGLN